MAIDADAFEVRVLDTPAVVREGHARTVDRPREQAVLVRVALAAPRPVPVDVLVAEVWGDAAPPRAIDTLRVHVSNLRKILGHDGRPGSEVLRTTPGGYRLDVPERAVDAIRLEGGVRHGAVDALRPLLGAWPDYDLGRLDAGTGYFEGAARRLADLRLAAVEVVATADLDAGRPAAAAALLEGAVERAPFRERLWELLVAALAAADRRAEALRAFQRARTALAEVGMGPGPALVAAEGRVLDDARDEPPVLAAEYIDVDGSRIAFATLGHHRRDLLFMHGGFVPFEVMREPPRLARFITELARRFRVVFVDRRGIGMSDPPTGGTAVAVDHWVADCKAVLDAVESRDVVVFGHEHAGPVAVRLAAELPDRVTGLVLHSTAARPLRAADHPYGPADDAFEWIDRMINRLPGTGDVLAVVAPSAGPDPALKAWLDRAGRLGAGPARARELHRAYLETDVRDALPTVNVPAVVLHPARMIRTDPGQARYLAENLPDAELQLLDSGDHLFWLADADVVLAAVDRLLARIDGAAAGTATRLRALVAVAPPVDAGVLASYGAETCVSVEGAAVATFTSLAAANAAATAVRDAVSGATVTVEVADTTGIAGDSAVIATARAVRTSPGGG